jgi:MFS family permease
LIGSICGVLVAGSLSDYLGRKLTMLISAALFSISAIGCAVCGSFDGLVAFRIIGGVGIGIVSIVSPIYISEVSPAKIRGTLVSLYQLAVTVGFLLAYLANWVIDSNIDSSLALGDPNLSLWERMMNTEAWRGMLGSETLPALIFFLVIFFIPESPKWLILKGKMDKAATVLGKIYSLPQEVEAEITVTKDSL